MKSFLKSAGTLLLYAYFFVAFFSAGFFNWQYANRNGFGSWLCFGEVIATLKAPVWPYFIFFDKSEGKENNQDSAHAIAAMDAFKPAFMLATTKGVDNLSETEKQTFEISLETAIREADQVSESHMEKTLPGSAQQYKTNFIGGMRSLLEGSKENNIAKLTNGGVKINNYISWTSKEVSKK